MYETQVIEIWQLISSMFLLKVKNNNNNNNFSQCLSLFKEICLNILILQYIFGKQNHVSIYIHD